MRLSKKRLMLSAVGGVNGIIGTKNKLIKKECENTIPIKTWKRNCPDCGKEIVYYYSSNFYYARSHGRLCSHCCIKGNKSSFYGGKQWTKKRRLWWSKNCPNLFTRDNNPTSDPLVRKKISDFGKTRIGNLNPMFGKLRPYNTGYGLCCQYKGFHFRSLYELSYFIIEIERKNKKCISAEHLYCISYKDINGIDKTYRPDFLVNDKYLVEVKPKEFWKRDDVLAKKDAAESFCKTHGLIYSLIDIRPNTHILKEKFLMGELKFSKKYEKRFRKYVNIE